MIIREAHSGDIPLLAQHHRIMFEEIWASAGRRLQPEVGDELEGAYAAKLADELPGGRCRVWVMEQGGEIVASGAISILNMVPTPNDLSLRVAYLHSMYTAPEYRKAGCASRIIQETIAYCREHGINRIFLNASAAGRPVYQTLGFQTSPETMRLDLSEAGRHPVC